MNQWDSIKEHYERHFKEELTTWQCKLFMMGTTHKADIGLRVQRQRIENQIAPWEVVVKLAMLWTYNQVKAKKLVFKGEFTYKKLNGFLYDLLWKSEFQPVKLVKWNGTEFYARTFWGWAVENKHRYQPTVAKKGVQKVDNIILNAAERIMKSRGMAG